MRKSSFGLLGLAAVSLVVAVLVACGSGPANSGGGPNAPGSGLPGGPINTGGTPNNTSGLGGPINTGGTPNNTTPVGGPINSGGGPTTTTPAAKDGGK